MSTFVVDPSRCISCAACVKDCLPRALHMENNLPTFTASRCMRCLHCLAICPTGAISMLGHKPQDCLPIRGHFPAPESLEALIRGRRSIRRFKHQPVEQETLRHLLKVAAHAPTASNRRGLHLTVLDNLPDMNTFREEVYHRLTLPAAQTRLAKHPRGPFFIQVANQWKARHEDAIFRGAPHCLIVSNDRESGYNLPVDPVIFLTTFELMAQASGIGTLWCGFLYSCLTFFIPEFRDELGIPAAYTPQYTMLFGYPDISYPRSVEHNPYPTLSLHRPHWDDKTETEESAALKGEETGEKEE